jgi:hypothetical protein
MPFAFPGLIDGRGELMLLEPVPDARDIFCAWADLPYLLALNDEWRAPLLHDVGEFMRQEPSSWLRSRGILSSVEHNVGTYRISKRA